MLSVNEQKRLMGFARLFRPTLAGANMGHPSRFAWFWRADSVAESVDSVGLREVNRCPGPRLCSEGSAKRGGHGRPFTIRLGDGLERKGQMTPKKNTAGASKLRELLLEDEDLLRGLMKQALEQVLEAEMSEALGAGKSERSEGRLGYRSGYYGRSLITRVGKLELRVPQDRQGRFRTEVFARYQRSEKALVHAVMEMYIQGVSTRKVKAITEELCGHEFSASTVSEMVQKLDEELDAFAHRHLGEEYPYLILDARYEKVRERGTVRSQAVLIAIGINREGRRCVLGVELANRESTTSWKDLLQGLRQRGLRGVEFVVSDDHAGLRRAIAEVLTEATWQRCYVHFLQRVGLPTAQGRRRLPDGVALAIRPAGPGRGAEGFGSLAGKMDASLPQAVPVGGGEHRFDVEFLPFAPRTPQASEVDQHVRAVDGRVEAENSSGAHFSQRRKLLAFSTSPRRGDPRKLDRGHTLPEHGTSGGTKERKATNGSSGLTEGAGGGGEAEAVPSPAPHPAQGLTGRSLLLNLTDTTARGLSAGPAAAGKLICKPFC
jgi:hypothetical protein